MDNVKKNLAPKKLGIKVRYKVRYKTLTLAQKE